MNRQSFDAFGNRLAGAATQINSHGYTGERVYADTGLIYLRARDYDPATCRFINMDEHPGSQRIPLTINKYLYTNADPVNYTDPSGNFGIDMSMSTGMSIAAISTISLAGIWGVYNSIAVDLMGNRRFGIWDAVSNMHFKKEWMMHMIFASLLIQKFRTMIQIKAIIRFQFVFAVVWEKICHIYLGVFTILFMVR